MQGCPQEKKTFSGYLTRNLLQFAQHRGVDIDSLCATVGFNLALLEMPDRRIPRSLHYGLWQEIIRQTGDQNMGLHLGEAFTLGNYGVAGYVLLNCRTLEEVFEKFCRYTCLFCQGVLNYLSVADGMAFLDCDSIPEIAPDPLIVAGARYDIESTFTSCLNAIQSLTGKPFRPLAVWFRHQAPPDLSEYERIFQAELKFAMPVNRLIFEAACLDWPILSSNANLLPFFEQQAEAMLGEIEQPNRYSQKVAQTIARQLQGELPTIDEIAAELFISTRQLQRNLKAEGTSFQKMLDQTRQELALQYLKDPAIPTHDIAFLLGFSEPSAFTRAFKRWTGKPPRSYGGQA
ncbi:MAG TPA: AraC family transcriptional regulator [Chroococcidiopsis sp.]